ncbi:MAG: zinc-finger family protein [Burkholderia sp.]|nr:zinc-finger family protein [Burkholderia sp.]
MDCVEFQSLIAAYVDEELPVQDMLRASSHLSGCPDCNEDYRQMLQLRDTVRTHASSHATPRHLAGRIRMDLKRARKAGSGTLRLPQLSQLPWRWISAGFASGCAAMFAIVLGLHAMPSSPNAALDEELVASHYRSLLVDHLTDVASSDQHTVKPWFTGKVDFSPPVPDLAAEGYALAGGRMDYLAHRPVVALAYRHRQHVINLFIWPDDGRNTGKAGTMQGFQLVHWSQSGMNYWLVSDLNADELAQFRELLAQAIARSAPKG